MYVFEFVCGFVRVCTFACVRERVRDMQEKSILVVQIQYFENEVFLYSIQAKPKTSIFFDGRAGSLTGNSPIMSCEKECSGASDEGIYD